MTRKYGWIKDHPDERDLGYFPRWTAITNQPSSLDLRAQCPPVYDQGQLGSCTANAIAGAIQFNELKADWLNDWVPSRLFIYYNERVIEGDVDQDAGASLRDGLTTVSKQGVCTEGQWPYDITQFAVLPPASVYADAAKDLVDSYMSVTQLTSNLKACLLEGFPFFFGFTVYESFESDEVAATGIIPMPNTQTEEILGGHAVDIVGYDDSKEAFIIRNSWGSDWGLAGYAYMPYSYVTDSTLASDFWTVRSAPGQGPLSNPPKSAIVNPPSII
jgi:C1A family cysteine protease